MGKNQTKLKRMTGQPFVGYQRKKTENKIIVKRTNFEVEGKKWVQNVCPKCATKVIKGTVTYLLMMTERAFLKYSGNLLGKRRKCMLNATPPLQNQRKDLDRLPQGEVAL
ncbi:hypothetical protein J6590_091255 [Homalodisca vitripennis]|nr:hypothetical protein J6590_091255 [Homalodisca vitripennis]